MGREAVGTLGWTVLFLLGGVASAQDQPETGPVPEGPTAGGGQWRHVAQGECICSIAKATGHFWEVLWNHSTNAELKRRRRDPNVLLPGDAVFLPHKRPKEESGNTDAHHKFRRRGEPGILRLVVKEMDEPRANQPYILKVGGQEWRGVTDPAGRIERPIPSQARKATLIVGEGEDQAEYELNLGRLDPIETVSGVKARLSNLGYDVGAVNGVIGQKTIAAIGKFCRDHGIKPPPDGQIGPDVRNKLREVHGF